MVLEQVMQFIQEMIVEINLFFISYWIILFIGVFCILVSLLIYLTIDLYLTVKKAYESAKRIQKQMYYTDHIKGEDT